MSAAAHCTSASESRDPLTDAIQGIDTTALDCVQVNAAVLADAAHGTGAYLELGRGLGFSARVAAPGRLPTVEQRPCDQIGQMAGSLPLALDAGQPVTGGAKLLDLLPEDGSPLYVIGDAYRMPWLPYHGHQHMDHSVLLRATHGGSRVEAIDAYDNETPYGRAEPVVCAYERPQAAALFDGSPATPVSVRQLPADRQPPARALARNADGAALLLEGDAPERYAAAFRDYADQQEACTALLLETWLLNRSRRLHAAWVSHRAPGSAHASATAERAAAWDDLAGQCYLAARRVQRGRPVPPQIHDTLAQLLRKDAEVAVRAACPEPGGTMPADPAQIRRTVTEIVADVMGIDPEVIPATDDLSRLEGFASFQMVETVERLEDAYGVEFAPSDLEPAVLRSIDGLADLVLRTTAGTAVAHS